MRPPNEKRPTGISGRAHLDTVQAGERNKPDDTTPLLDLEADEAWKARIVRDAELQKQAMHAGHGVEEMYSARNERRDAALSRVPTEDD